MDSLAASGRHGREGSRPSAGTCEHPL